MVIKVSSSAEVRALVEALADGEVRREGAIARLTVIGSRAIDRLAGAYQSATDTRLKVGILRALEGIADPRGLPLACDALAEGGDVAVAAAAALEPLLDAKDPATATAALDALVEAALAPSGERRVRLAARTALQRIPPDMLARITEAQGVTEGGAREDAAYDALIADAADGKLPGEAAELRDALVSRGAHVALGSLHRIVDAVRERERSARAGKGKDGLREARGAAHQALALRGSRVALYDLRETIEAADRPLPPSFLFAMRAAGDATCVEALAAALARAPEHDLWWRHQLASALRGVARRERMTRRHPSIKRALARWPQAAGAFP